MNLDVRTNPALLKLDLYCKGLRIDDSCKTAVDKRGRPIMRTRAGLGSGLELILPDKIWTNVPVVEDFVKQSPYTLHTEDGKFVLRLSGDRVCEVRVPKEPDFYEKLTSSGRKMKRIGVLQGTYIGIYPTAACYYWTKKPRENCDFCSVGLNLGTEEEEAKLVQDVVETCIAAQEECNITYVHFNTGFYEGDTYLDQLEPYIKAVRQHTGLLIGVQTPPHPDFRRYDRLREMGVNTVSFCFEFFNKEVFDRRCPGKSRHVGLQRYLDAVAYCAKLFDTTNGEIVAGPEPVPDTLAAIDWITSVGAIPTVCIFRPLRGTDAEKDPPPNTEEMVPVFKRLYERCMERNLPIGIAHNVEVSIVLKPEECHYFSDHEGKYLWNKAKIWLGNKVLRGILWWQRTRARLYRSRNPLVLPSTASCASRPLGGAADKAA